MTPRAWLGALSATVLWCVGCRPKPRAPRRGETPVVLVHGIFGDPQAFAVMSAFLRREGVRHVEAVRLTPNDGTVPVETYGAELDRFVRGVSARHGDASVDLVGYSMGALVSRYWLQRLGGRGRTRRFVSISGPQHGAVGAYLSSRAAALEMRPGSRLLRDLERDRDPFGPVEVYDFWTPLDVMVFPANTARLQGARLNRRFVVRSHHDMLLSRRVLRAVADTLLEEVPPPPHPSDELADELLEERPAGSTL
ncbi:MAG: lipase [Deltaproteobacteria bacterium]|nr:lipase [Deltaproteobacteria bacterium]